MPLPLLSFLLVALFVLYYIGEHNGSARNAPGATASPSVSTKAALSGTAFADWSQQHPFSSFQAPLGWHSLGEPGINAVSGRFHSWTNSYTPEASTAELGVGRIVVKILVAEQPADYNKALEEVSQGLEGLSFFLPEDTPKPSTLPTHGLTAEATSRYIQSSEGAFKSKVTVLPSEQVSHPTTWTPEP